MKKNACGMVDNYLINASEAVDNTPFLEYNFEYVQLIKKHAPRAQRVQGLIERMSGNDQITVEEYLEDLDELHDLEQKALYLQSFVDTVQLLNKNGMLKLENADQTLKEVIQSVIED